MLHHCINVHYHGHLDATWHLARPQHHLLQSPDPSTTYLDLSATYPDLSATYSSPHRYLLRPEHHLLQPPALPTPT